MSKSANSDTQKNMLILGGDLRQIYCGKRLAKQYEVYYIGFDDKLPNIQLRKADKTMISFFDYIVLPVLAMQSGDIINTPFSKEKYTLSDLKKLAKPSCKILGGRLDGAAISYLKDYPIYDYLEREELNIRNAVPTALSKEV